MTFISNMSNVQVLICLSDNYVELKFCHLKQFSVKLNIENIVMVYNVVLKTNKCPII